MQSSQRSRSEVALYWSAVSLIVCDGLWTAEVAARLGVEEATLIDMLYGQEAPGSAAGGDEPEPFDLPGISEGPA